MQPGISTSSVFSLDEAATRFANSCRTRPGTDANTMPEDGVGTRAIGESNLMIA